MSRRPVRLPLVLAALATLLAMLSFGLVTASNANAIDVPRKTRTVAHYLTIDTNVPISITVNGKAYVAQPAGTGNYRVSYRFSAGTKITGTVPARTSGKKLVSWYFEDGSIAANKTTVTRTLGSSSEKWSVFYD